MDGFPGNIVDISGVPFVAQPGMVTIALGINTAKLVVPADPLRTNLIISGDGTTQIWIGTSNAVTVGQGLALTVNYPVFEFSLALHGQLVQLAFWGFSSGSAHVSYLAQSVSRFSDVKGPPTLIQQTDKGDFRGHIARRENSAGPTKLYSNRWGKRQAAQIYRIPDL